MKMILKQLSNIGLPQLRRISSTTAAVTRLRRSVFCRQYPTVLVQPDGSTINFRYYEPRKVIKLPLNLTLLVDADRKARLEARKPRKTLKIMQEVEDSFNASKYLKYIKKK